MCQGCYLNPEPLALIANAEYCVVWDIVQIAQTIEHSQLEARVLCFESQLSHIFGQIEKLQLRGIITNIYSNKENKEIIVLQISHRHKNMK